MTVIISGLIFAWTLVVLLGLFTVFEERKRLDRLLQETGFNSEYPGAQKTEKNSLLELAKKLSMGQRLVNYLLQAGVPLRLEEALLIGGAVFLLLGYLIVAGLFIEALALTIVLMFLPSLWLASVRGKRIRKFDGQLGEAMVLMANSMRAGFSFFQAMDLIAKEAPMPLGGEFSGILKEIQLGMPTERALSGVLQRVASEDLEMMVTAVLIQRQVGGNLAEVLDKISETITERVRIKGEIKTLTAQGRISGMIIGSLPLVLAFILMLINPEYIKVLITDPVGPILIIYGVISQIMGALMIRKIVSLGI